MTSNDPRKPWGERIAEAVNQRTVIGQTEKTVPAGLRIASSYAWRLLVIVGALAVVIWVIVQLKLLVVPMLVSILLTALLWPVFTWMLRRGVPRWLAIVISVAGTIAIVVGLVWLAVWQIRAQWDSVRESTEGAIGQLRAWLLDGPLHLTSQQIDDWLAQGASFLKDQTSSLFSGALAVGSTVGHVATGALLSFFILLCTLADGRGIWRWTLRLLPRAARPTVDEGASAGWLTVVRYARTQLLVATIDAIGIGVGAFLLGVPLAIPIGVLVFLGAFVPFVGAIVTGTLAVFLALVYNGPWIALAMLAVVLGVQQLESHVLQPILMGSAVKVHPLAVVLVVAGGAMIAGIPGALFAVPLAAFVNVFAVTVASRHGTAPGGQLIWQSVPRARAPKDAAQRAAAARREARS